MWNWPSTLSCTFPWALENIREHWKISSEHSSGSLRPCAFYTDKASTCVGISVDIFVYTPVCIFVSTFVREFVGQISRFACSALVWVNKALTCWAKRAVNTFGVYFVFTEKETSLDSGAGRQHAICSTELPWFRSGPGKPKQRKVSSWTFFRRGIPKQKNKNLWIVLVFLRKNTRIHKRGETHELFVLALSLVWFAGGDSWLMFCTEIFLEKFVDLSVPAQTQILGVL